MEVVFSFVDILAMVMLAPATILTGYAGPLFARNMSSYVRLLFLNDMCE